MPGGKKLVVVLSVLATGVSTALFFRKDASQESFRHEASLENPFRQRVDRRVVADTTWTRNLQAARSKTARLTEALRVPATASIPQGLATDSQPTIQRNVNPVGALLEPIENIPPEEDAPRSAGGTTLTGFETNMPAATTPHRIVDGDTLSKLSAEYLGRADRYLEIYELNRDVLSSPDLLPIGVTLKIPPKQKAEPLDMPSSQPWAPSNDDDQLRLAPVPASGGAG